MPLSVVDISEKLAVSASYKLSVEDLRAWEKINGSIKYDSIVLLRTNHHGLIFNGWDEDILEYLLENKSIAIGHD